MEPRTALAEYDPANGRYTLYASHGGVGRPRRDLAQMLGVPEAQIRVISRDVGGNFGPRNYTYPEFTLTAWAARRVGRPVKWVSDRSEGFLSDYQARDLTVTAELALDAEGNFLALRADNLSNLGAYAASLVPLTKGTELMSSLYRIPVVTARARAVLSNTPPTAPYRSAGRPEVMYVIERLIDLTAREHGFDRVEIRRRLAFRPLAAIGGDHDSRRLAADHRQRPADCLSPARSGGGRHRLRREPVCGRRYRPRHRSVRGRQGRENRSRAAGYITRPA